MDFTNSQLDEVDYVFSNESIERMRREKSWNLETYAW